MRLHTLLAVLALVCISGFSHASTITENITFTTSGFLAASGSFTLTFDPTLTYVDETTGLTVNSLSDGCPLPSSVAFSSDPARGILDIGGLAHGVYGIGADEVDFLLGLNTQASPTFRVFGASNGQNAVIEGLGTATIQLAVTPEPSSFALLGTGLLSVVAVMKRRFFRLH